MISWGDYAQMIPQRNIAHYRITAKLGDGGMGEVHHKAPPRGRYQDSAAAFAADAGRITKSNPLGRAVAMSDKCPEMANGSIFR